MTYHLPECPMSVLPRPSMEYVMTTWPDGVERRNPGDVAEARDRSGVFGFEYRECASHVKHGGEERVREDELVPTSTTWARGETAHPSFCNGFVPRSAILPST